MHANISVDILYALKFLKQKLNVHNYIVNFIIWSLQLRIAELE